MLGPEGYTALLSESFRHFLIFIKSIMDSYWEKKKILNDVLPQNTPMYF